MRTRMERGLGHSFARVRIHDDARGDAVVASTRAAAATRGEDIAFAAGAFRPDTIGGTALLAHELAHVAQHDPSLPVAPGIATDAGVEADADRAAAAALAPHGRERRGVSRRAGGGLWLAGCNQEAVRSERDLLAEGNAASADITGQATQLGIPLAEGAQLSDEARTLRVTADDAIWSIEALQTLLHAELAAATDDDQRRRIQRRYLEQLRRMRSAFRRRLAMQQRWGIPFLSGNENQSFGVAPHQQFLRTPVTWSVEELDAVDAILGRMPPGYVRNARAHIQGFMRESGSGGSAAASYDPRTHFVRVFDNALERPGDLTNVIVHEIGHGTYRPGTERHGAATFDRLPPVDWMRLSDWKVTSVDTMAADLARYGSEPVDAASIRSQLGGAAGFSVETNQFRGVPINGRMVVADRYELGGGRTRFFHYDLRRNSEFVSDYARSHPGEDLAESFSRFMQNPEWLRAVSQAKHDWMRAHHARVMAADPNARCS